MTIEEIVQAVEDETGHKVTAATELKNILDDSLEFASLIVFISGFSDIPDAIVYKINTVNDLHLAVEGKL